MTAKRNVCFQGLPSLTSSEVIRASVGSAEECRVPPLASSDVTSTPDSDALPSLADPAPGDSGQPHSGGEETSTLPSVASSCFAAYLRAGSLSEGSTVAADSVCLLPRSATPSSVRSDRERGVWRRNVLLLAALGVFAAACAVAVGVDRRWSLFAVTGWPVGADSVAESGAAVPLAALSGATTVLQSETTEAEFSATAASLASKTAIPSSLPARKKPAVTHAGTTSSAEGTTEPSIEDDATPDEADYLTLENHRSSTRRLGTGRKAEQPGSEAHAPREPAKKQQPHWNRQPANAKCGMPLFTLCTRPRREYYYHPQEDTCTPATGSPKEDTASLSLCNRSPNRFSSLDSCRRSCMTSVMPAQRCFDKPVFTGCSRSYAQNLLNDWRRAMHDRVYLHAFYAAASNSVALRSTPVRRKAPPAHPGGLSSQEWRRRVIIFSALGFVVAVAVLALLLLGRFVPEEWIRGTTCQTQVCDEMNAMLVEARDADVNPCDNFYRHVCGRWPAKHNGLTVFAENVNALFENLNAFLAQRYLHFQPDICLEIWLPGRALFKNDSDDAHSYRGYYEQARALYGGAQASQTPNFDEFLEIEIAVLEELDFPQRYAGTLTLNSTAELAHIVSPDRLAKLVKYFATEHQLPKKPRASVRGEKYLERFAKLVDKLGDAKIIFYLGWVFLQVLMNGLYAFARAHEGPLIDNGCLALVLRTALSEDAVWRALDKKLSAQWYQVFSGLVSPAVVQQSEADCLELTEALFGWTLFHRFMQINRGESPTKIVSIMMEHVAERFLFELRANTWLGETGIVEKNFTARLAIRYSYHQPN
ncbi:hypothetical protein V5799_004238 [Amblyomma americanum]|uniref:Uncharacterized protein n=2 Tax=Amblyomma americanum TaxID=6943 RepID=A0AAQ4D6P2_AMBAM